MATWVNLLDIIYPVGSIYHSTSSTSPASAASVTLSLSQIPAHSHQWKGWNWLQTEVSSGDKALVVGSDIAGSTASAGGGLLTIICRHITQFIFGGVQRRRMVGGVA